jgi:hypothetical protein
MKRPQKKTFHTVYVRNYHEQIFKYSIILFLPYPETGEFANIGIVLYVPALQRLVYKLLNPSQHERITHFFQPLTQDLFGNIVQIIRDELERIQKLLAQTTLMDAEPYNELIRPREDIIRYSENRVIVSTSPENTVAELFEYYVHHRTK